MADAKKEFRISFCALLADITKALEWPNPIYSQTNLAMNQANLVLLRGPGPTACFFKGETGRTLAESEEQAAEQAVDFLVHKKQVIIDDVNLERRNKYKACCNFFKEKRGALEAIKQPASNMKPGLGKKLRVAVPTSLPKMITVDLWAIWLQVVEAYKVTADEVDFITQSNGLYVCCFAITWPDHASKERFFIGESFDTVDKAKQSLAKKAIQYFQTLYGFSVKDANFNRMKYSQIQCGFQRRRYLLAKEQFVCFPSDLESASVFISDGCRTPEGPAYGIRSALTLPPAPKKAKTTSMGCVQISGVCTSKAAAANRAVSISSMRNGTATAVELQTSKIPSSS